MNEYSWLSISTPIDFVFIDGFFFSRLFIVVFAPLPPLRLEKKRPNSN